MLTIRNSDNTIQIGDDFANYRLMRSYVKPVSEFQSEGGGAQLDPVYPARGSINVSGIESPLVVIRPYNNSYRGAVTVGAVGNPAQPVLMAAQKSLMYQVEVFIFGRTTRAATGNEPKLLMRNAANVVSYDSRHIPFVLEDFVTVTQTVPENAWEISLGTFLPGKGLGICLIGPRSNFFAGYGSTSYGRVQTEGVRITTSNEIWLCKIRLWDTAYGNNFQFGSFDMTDNPFYMMLVDVNKLPIPYENV